MIASTEDKIMPADIAFLIDISDRAAFFGYGRAAAPTYAMYGGGVALRGPIVGQVSRPPGPGALGRAGQPACHFPVRRAVLCR